MSGHALTRRSFLVGSAGVASVAAGAGLVSLSVRGDADADADDDNDHQDPKTGDDRSIILISAIAVVSLAAFTSTYRKKKNN